MKSYQCPNCGRIYNYGDSVDSNVMLQCMNCRYSLKRVGEVKNVAHPELNPMLNNNHVIGTINDPTKSTVTCPYCQSKNTKKITTTSKAVHTALFGIFSISRNSKNYHCNNCDSDF